MKFNHQYITIVLLVSTILILSVSAYKVATVKENLPPFASQKICQNFMQSCSDDAPCCSNKNLQCVGGKCVSA